MDAVETTEATTAGTRNRRPYAPPHLRPIGSIADVTQAEGSGPGLTGTGSQQRDVTIFNGTSLDSDEVSRIIKP